MRDPAGSGRIACLSRVVVAFETEIAAFSRLHLRGQGA